MSALVLDAGAFVAVERDDRTLIARLRVAQRRGLELRSNAIVVAQVRRDSQGRQARLARLLHSVDVRPVDDEAGRAAGVLIGRAGTRIRSTPHWCCWPLLATAFSPAIPRTSNTWSQ